MQGRESSRKVGFRKLRADGVPASEPPGATFGRMVSLRDYDCNMKAGLVDARAKPDLIARRVVRIESEWENNRSRGPRQMHLR